MWNMKSAARAVTPSTETSAALEEMRDRRDWESVSIWLVLGRVSDLRDSLQEK